MTRGAKVTCTGDELDDTDRNEVHYIRRRGQGCDARKEVRKQEIAVDLEWGPRVGKGYPVSYRPLSLGPSRLSLIDTEMLTVDHCAYSCIDAGLPQSRMTWT